MLRWILIVAALMLLIPPTAAADDFEMKTVGDQLATAIDSGSVAAVRRMLDEGVSPDTLVYDTPPLTWAIWDDRYFVVKLLVDRGANVNLPDDEGYTPLMSAAQMSNKRIVTLLVEHGADINAVELTYGMSPLQSACEVGDEAIVDLLLAKGADVEHIDKYGGNCLEEAAKYGYAKIVEKLRAKGLTSDWPLHVAAGLGNMEEVKRLLAVGGEVDQVSDGWQETPLTFAVGGGQLEVAKFLAEQGAGLDSKNVLGAGLLHVAAGADHLEVAKWLIAQAADVNAKDKQGLTPLDWATGEEVTELLKQHGGEYGEYEYEEGE